MSYSNDLDQKEAVVQRLRELHAGADDADRKNAALLLGLAIADLVESLPESDSRRDQLATEGQKRLDESGATTNSAATALAQLKRANASQPPDPTSVGTGLNWNVDWEALSEPIQAARQVHAMMPMFATMFPAGSPLRQAVTDFTGVVGVAEDGQSTADRATGLAEVTRLVEEAGLGGGLGPVLRMQTMLMKVAHCSQTEQAGGQPDWPALAELDAVIAEVEAEDLDEWLNIEPFTQLAGLPHVWIANLLTARLLVDNKTRTGPPDVAWRDDALRLLDRADDHLSQAPPAYDAPVRQLRSALAKPRAALRDLTVPSGHPPAQPAPPPPRLKRTEPTKPEPGAGVGGQAAAAGPSFDGVFDLLTNPDGRAALRLVSHGAETNALAGMGHMTGSVEAIFAGRWTSQAEQSLAGLEQHLQRLNADAGSSLTERAVVTAMLAQARLTRWNLRSSNSRLDERPPRSEGLALAGELEAALDLLDEAATGITPSSDLASMRNMMHVSAGILLTELRETGDGQLDQGRTERAHEHLDQVPAEFLSQHSPFLADAVKLQRLFSEGRPATPEENAILANRFGEVFDITGGTLVSAEAAVARARQNPSAESIGAALNELTEAGIALPAGSPLHFSRLTLLAEAQTMLAWRTTEPFAAYDAIGTAVEALRTAKTSSEQRVAALLLVAMLGLMTVKGLREGPFAESEELFSAALANASPEDWPLRTIATVGLGASKGLRASATGDRLLQQASARLIAEARQLLPPPAFTSDWRESARALFTWTSIRAMYGADPDPDSAAIALHVGDLLNDLITDRADAEQFATDLAMRQEVREQLLALATPASDESSASETASSPPISPDAEVQGRLAHRLVDEAAATLNRHGPDGQPRRPLSGLSEAEAASLRNLVTELHAVAEAFFQDRNLRRQVDEMIGRCAAELHRSDPGQGPIDMLGEAVLHLNRALTSARPELPAVPRADLLDTLSRCRREVARRHEDEAERTQGRLEADRAGRAAIRELARCVLLAPDTDAALRVAARANDVVARCIGWSLTDGNQRAALELAEAGRGLVLASVVTAGQVEEVLRGAGEHDLADGWRHGGEPGRIAALDAFWKPGLNANLLTPPTSDMISIMLAGTRTDALVYLAPPEERDGEQPPPGHAIILRSVTGVIEVVELPGLGDADRAPLAAYLAALQGAVDALDEDTKNPDGFSSGSAGRKWADALVQLGSWTYDRIMEPLIEHVRGWNLGRRPNLTLIPLGKLAAIPYAAAWTDEPGPEGSDSRRLYAIEDVVLSYAASARLLGEISRRPRQGLNDRVVIVTDPTGMFAMSRATARLLAGNIYPRAEVYGRKRARNGFATIEALLDALPAADRPGASLLHLVTHGTTDPEPQLKTTDGWLTLNRILDQARGRAPDAPGGLVITSACLTDSTRANYDESLTLATAFLAAGACSVIGTRWPVEDAMTAALSMRLHYHLQMGLPSGEALRQAQLDLIRPTAEIRKSLGRILEAVEPERLSHPASWAGYVQHGSDNRKTA